MECFEMANDTRGFLITHPVSCLTICPLLGHFGMRQCSLNTGSRIDVFVSPTSSQRSKRYRVAYDLALELG